MSDYQIDSLESAICGAHAAHDSFNEVTRDIMEMHFAIQMAGSMLGNVDNSMPPEQHMKFLKCIPAYVWSMARDMVKHKFPHLYEELDEEPYPPIGEGAWDHGHDNNS